MPALVRAENTVINICNHNTDRAIFSAYMLSAGGGAGWQSHGWYKVASQQCFALDLGTYIGNVYLFSQDEFQQSTWGEGAPQFCVNKTIAFSINNADTVACTDSGLEKVSSDELTVKAGANAYDVNPNFSQVNFCNQNTAVPVFATYAMPENGSLTSTGWYQIAPGKCYLATLGKYTGPLSYYAEYNGGSLVWDGGPDQYCINKTTAFTIPNADDATKCTDASLKLVKARHLTVAVGVNTVNFEAQSNDSLLKLCNTTPQAVQTSYGITTTGSLVQTKGWIALASQQCSTIDLGSYSGVVYLYAEVNQGQTFWGSGPASFCVNRTQNFTIADGANQAACNSDITLKWVPTFQTNVLPGTTSFSFNP
jgi:uncharacterized membrane protein